MKFSVLRKRSVLELLMVDARHREEAEAKARAIPVADWHVVNRETEYDSWKTTKEDEFP